MVHQPSAVSNSDVSIMPPLPVAERRTRAASTPIAAHMPVPWSRTWVPMRIGGPSGWPLIIIKPEKAWTIGSKPGRSLSGPTLPSARSEQ